MNGVWVRVCGFGFAYFWWEGDMCTKGLCCTEYQRGVSMGPIMYRLENIGS